MWKHDLLPPWVQRDLRAAQNVTQVNRTVEKAKREAPHYFVSFNEEQERNWKPIGATNV